jgi:ribosomal protein L32
MREIFFYVLGGTLAIALSAWALYMLGRAIVEVFRDRKLARELDEIQSESESRRQKRRQAQEDRLATGCDHDFSAVGIGLPPNVCRKCGLEKEKTSTLCDHVWRVKSGASPYSECERCGKVYRPVPHASDQNPA